MGQVQSVKESVPDSVDDIQIQVVKHAKVLSEICLLSYDDFQKCLDGLNELSRKCLDTNGKQLVFVVKKGTDSTLLWKATIKIACVKVDLHTKKVEQYKLLNLKEFLCVFKTFQSHLESLISSEEQHERRGSFTQESSGDPITASTLMDQVRNVIYMDHSNLNSTGNLIHDHSDECCICLDRHTEVILPCTHSFCAPCIEQWNVSNKTCPICNESLESTDETWIISELPGVDEINDKICDELMNLSTNIGKAN